MPTSTGTVLVFDEMITGFRWSASGAQDRLRRHARPVDLGQGDGQRLPDLGAGRAPRADGARRAADADRVFLLSTTHGPETVGLAAFRAVEREYRSWDVVGTLEERGSVLAQGFAALLAKAGLESYVRLHGRPSCLVFETRDATGQPSQAYRTLFLQELLDRGVLAQSLVVTTAHTDDDMAWTLDAVEGALEVYARAIEAGSTDGLLRGRPVAPALRERAEPRRIGSAGPVSRGRRP